MAWIKLMERDVMLREESMYGQTEFGPQQSNIIKTCLTFRSYYIKVDKPRQH